MALTASLTWVAGRRAVAGQIAGVLLVSELIESVCLIPFRVRGCLRFLFFVLLRHLGDLGCHFGAQLDAKGLPKSSVLVPSRGKMSKNDAQNEASKNI